MQYTITTINRKHDTFGCWSVSWENRGGDTGLYKIAAVIVPSWEVLGSRLGKDGYVDYHTCSYIINPLGLHPFVNKRNYGKSMQVLNAFVEFCESEKRIIEKRVYSFWDAFGGGNTGAFAKAQKKIKKELVLEGEDTVYKRLVAFLRTKRVITSI